MKTPLQHVINIGQGLGAINFGLSPDDLGHCLGAPDESEIVDPSTGSTMLWYYESQKLQIIFQKPMDALFVANASMSVNQITTRNQSATFCGTKIIGLRENVVLELFRKHGYDRFETEFSDIPGDTSFRIERLRLTLGFYHGLLHFVLLGTIHP